MTRSRKIRTRRQWQPASLTRISHRYGNARHYRDEVGEALLRGDQGGAWGRRPLRARLEEPREPGGGRQPGGERSRPGKGTVASRDSGDVGLPGLCVTMTMVNRFTGFQGSGYVQCELQKAQSSSSSRTHVPIHGSAFTFQKTTGLENPLEYLVLVTGHSPDSDLY